MEIFSLEVSSLVVSSLRVSSLGVSSLEVFSLEFFSLFLNNFPILSEVHEVSVIVYSSQIIFFEFRLQIEILFSSEII